MKEIPWLKLLPAIPVFFLVIAIFAWFRSNYLRKKKRLKKEKDIDLEIASTLYSNALTKIAAERINRLKEQTLIDEHLHEKLQRYLEWAKVQDGYLLHKKTADSMKSAYERLLRTEVRKWQSIEEEAGVRQK